MNLKGSYVALVTPFHEDGSVYSASDYLSISGKQESPEVFAQPPKWYMKEMKQ